ncbi:MAG: Ig-like domain-containing protein, partial [Gammaproteobacteria bacterium]
MKQHYFHPLLIATLLGLNIGGCSQAPPLLIVPVTTGESVRLHVKLDKTSSRVDWQRSFAIYVDDDEACCGGRLPIQGTYHVDKDGVTFEPDFPFAEGTAYRVRVTSGILENKNDFSLKKVVEDGQEYFETQFKLPARQPKEPATVVRIYPSSE